MTPAGGQREKLHGKFANRLREKIRGDGEDFLGKAARRKARGREEGGENLCPCDQTTQKLERHKLIKMHSASPRQPLTFSPLCFIPPFSLSHFTSLHHLAASFSCRRAGSDGGGGRPRPSDVFGWLCALLPEVTAATFPLRRSQRCQRGWVAVGRALVFHLAALFGLSSGGFVAKVLLQHYCGEAAFFYFHNTLLVTFHNSWFASTSACEVSLLLLLQCYWDYFK